MTGAVPSLSFVVPTRNQARFIRRCIDGCLAQGIDGAEVIVVDGLSDDGTQEILASYGERIRWTSERDSGQAEAINKGIGRARGEVIAWINSDDAYAGPRVLREVLARFAADPGLDVVYGGALVVDDAGTVIRPYVTRDFRDARDVLLEAQGPAQPATFFRRGLFAQAGGLRLDLHLALDYELWLRMFALARRIERVPGELALVTAHPQAKSIAAMGSQIEEVTRIKRAAAARLRLGVGDRLKLERGIALNRLYVLAVKAGLRRSV
jgi:glycosyltransferase involved in cell wall biosynthesis